MVLLVEGQIVEASSLLAHPRLLSANQCFLARPPVLPAGAAVAYAAQGEVVEAGDCRLCTSDFTTCVAVAVVAGAVARMCHFDQCTTRSLVALQQTVAGLGRSAAKLWLAGGYDDCDGTGAAVVRQLLAFLQRCEAALEVQLCCLGSLNTAPDGSPRCTALTLDTATLEARPAAPPAHARCPLLPARMAQWAYASGGDDSQGRPLLTVAYDAPRQRLTLCLREGRPPPLLLRWAAWMLGLDDAQLLQRGSTSPLHEPPHFVADMRASYAWLLQQSGPVRCVERAFTWEAGEWQPAQAAGAAADVPPLAYGGAG